jgi:hypothetical protein
MNMTFFSRNERLSRDAAKTPAPMAQIAPSFAVAD